MPTILFFPCMVTTVFFPYGQIFRYFFPCKKGGKRRIGRHRKRIVGRREIHPRLDRHLTISPLFQRDSVVGKNRNRECVCFCSLPVVAMPERRAERAVSRPSVWKPSKPPRWRREHRPRHPNTADSPRIGTVTLRLRSFKPFGRDCQVLRNRPTGRYYLHNGGL